MSKQHPNLTARNFPSAQEEAGTPSLAFMDTEFLLRDELRPIRLQLELLRPELMQREQGIASTVVLFGSARIPAPEAAQQQLEAARASGDAARQRAAQACVALSRYYEEARRFAHMVTSRTRDMTNPLVICTGGGPGIMEAGNRGASEAGGPSIGMNIALPHEQAPNPYITPELSFQFHYFAIRKMHLLMRAVALVCFPGGFGTLDELFEVLTLVQTGKSRRRPILLFGREFWSRLINFELLADMGLINPEDTGLFHYVETAEQAWAILAASYGLEAGDPADKPAAEDF